MEPTCGRVASGITAPRLPRDPEVRDSRIRLFVQQLCLYTLCTTRGGTSGYRWRSAAKWVQFVRARCERRSYRRRHTAATRSGNPSAHGSSLATPPCGDPESGKVTAPSSITPAFSHLSIVRRSTPSRTLWRKLRKCPGTASRAARFPRAGAPKARLGSFSPPGPAVASRSSALPPSMATPTHGPTYAL